MSRMADIREFVRQANQATHEADLHRIMDAISHDMGFRHYALVGHFAVSEKEIGPIALHSYPQDWAEYWMARGWINVDPVLEASRIAIAGFEWSELPAHVDMTPDKQEVLDKAARRGLEKGFTVPGAFIVELPGTCSFVVGEDRALAPDNLLMANMVGVYAFAAARRMVASRLRAAAPRLTERQRECLILAMRGKTDWEIGRILGIREDTVSEHLDNAREKYGVAKRVTLGVRALYDGQVDFSEVIGSPLKGG